MHHFDYSIHKNTEQQSFQINFNTFLESNIELVIHIANKEDLYMSPTIDDRCAGKNPVYATIITPSNSQNKVCFHSLRMLNQLSMDSKKTTIPKGKSGINISIQNTSDNIKWEDISLNIKIIQYKADALYWLMVAGFYFILPFSILGLFIWFWYKSFVL